MYVKSWRCVVSIRLYTVYLSSAFSAWVNIQRIVHNQDNHQLLVVAMVTYGSLLIFKSQFDFIFSITWFLFKKVLVVKKKRERRWVMMMSHACAIVLVQHSILRFIVRPTSCSNFKQCAFYLISGVSIFRFNEKSIDQPCFECAYSRVRTWTCFRPN